MRINLLLLIGLLAVGSSGFAAEAEGSANSALNFSAQDSLNSDFASDLNPQPLYNSSTEGIKVRALGEYLPEPTESSSVFGEVKNFAEGAVKGVLKSPLMVIGGIKMAIGHLPGVGADPKSEKVETVDTLGIPPLEIKSSPTFSFEREFAKQLAKHRTAEDYEEEIRGTKAQRVLQILVLQMDFCSKD